MLIVRLVCVRWRRLGVAGRVQIRLCRRRLGQRREVEGPDVAAERLRGGRDNRKPRNARAIKCTTSTATRRGIADTHLELGRQLPEVDEDGDLLAQNDLQALKVQVCPACPVVHCAGAAKARSAVLRHTAATRAATHSRDRQR